MADKAKYRSNMAIRRKKLSPRTRFRAAIRLVIANAAWLVDGIDKGYNIKVYGTRKLFKSNFTFENKVLMTQDPRTRTEEEILQISKLISAYKCFRKYSEKVKILLAGAMRYSYVGPDRVIVRKNHNPTAIFFIISGELLVVEDKYDEFLDETERIVIKKMVSGEAIGEINLVQNVPRMQTIISSSPVEFLTLSRQAFNLVLKGTVKEEWDHISGLMSKFSYFQSWSKMEVGECSMQSIIQSFKKNDTVLGDGYGRKQYVYFVIKGSCDMIEDMMIIPTKTEGGVVQYSLVKPSTFGQSSMRTSVRSYEFNHPGFELSSVTEPRNTNVHDTLNPQSINYMSLKDLRKGETVFMRVCTFRAKACFSIGEPMLRRRIVANEDLTCLLIPFHLLIGQSNIWLRIKQFLKKTIPTTEEIYRELVKGRRWRQYKADLVKPLLTTYSCNWICNVPYAIRVKHDYTFKSDIPLTSKFQMKQQQVRKTIS